MCETEESNSFRSDNYLLLLQNVIPGRIVMRFGETSYMSMATGAWK